MPGLDPSDEPQATSDDVVGPSLVGFTIAAALGLMAFIAYLLRELTDTIAAAAAKEQPETPPKVPVDPDRDASQRDNVAGTIAGGFVLLTAGLGIFGGLTGSVARMARNEQWLTAAGVGLVLASVLLALWARLIHTDRKMFPKWKAFKNRNFYWNRFLLFVGLIVLVAGALISIMTLNAVLAKDDRPSITAQTTRDGAGNVTVSGTAKAGGLEAQDQVYVAVSDVSADGIHSKRIYYSQVGPNQDGLVDHAFSVIVSPKTAAVIISVGRRSLASGCSPPEPTPEPIQDLETLKPPNDLTACTLLLIGEPQPAVAATVAPKAQLPAKS